MPHKGYKMKEEHKKKIGLKSLGRPSFMKGKHWSKETVEKMSLARQGSKNPMWGKHFTVEQRKKMSEAQTGSKNHRYGCHFKHTEERKQKIREGVIAHPNKITKNTSIEIKIENELIKRGISYQKQVPLCKIARVDFYLPEYRIVIQADGCFWHGCPIHCQNKGIKCKEKDDRQDGVLTFNGFNVYRFWEHDINKSVSDCIDSLNLNI